MIYKVRISYTVQTQTDNETDAMNDCLSGVPSEATHVKMEVVSKFAAPVPEAAQAQTQGGT